MWRIILAVVVGYVLAGVLVVSTDGILSAIAPGMASQQAPTRWYFAISLLTDSLYSVAAGYVCALIARSRSRAAILGLIVLGECMGLVAQVQLWRTVPHWYGLGLLVLYPLGVWLGGGWRARQARAAAA